MTDETVVDYDFDWEEFDRNTIVEDDGPRCDIDLLLSIAGGVGLAIVCGLPLGYWLGTMLS